MDQCFGAEASRPDRAEGPLYVQESWPDRAEGPLYVPENWPDRAEGPLYVHLKPFAKRVENAS